MVTAALLWAATMGTVSLPCIVRTPVPGAPAGSLVEGTFESESEDAVELALAAGGRVWVGAASTVSCGPTFELRRGRVWLIATRAVELRARERVVRAEPGTWAVVDISGGEVVLAVARGRLEVHNGPTVGPGEMLGRSPGSDRVRKGGSGLVALARRGTSDPWVTERVRTQILDAFRSRDLPRPKETPEAGPFWGDPEVFGADGGATGWLLESAIRPSPF